MLVLHSTLIHTRPLDSHQHARIQTCCHTWSVGTNLVSTWWSLRCHIIWEHDQCPPIFTFTKPDISFAANKAWQFMGNPTTIHWLAVKQTLRYVKDTSSYDINMQQSDSLDIHGYTDADWASYLDDRRSTGGYGIFHWILKR